MLGELVYHSSAETDQTKSQKDRESGMIARKERGWEAGLSSYGGHIRDVFNARPTARKLLVAPDQISMALVFAQLPFAPRRFIA